MLQWVREPTGMKAAQWSITLGRILITSSDDEPIQFATHHKRGVRYRYAIERRAVFLWV